MYGLVQPERRCSVHTRGGSAMLQAFTGPIAGLLMLALADDGEKHLSVPRFTIPVSLAPERQADVKEVLLFVSRNKGKSWDLHSRIKPNQDGFPFLATNDGSYWFSVAVIDSKGAMEPRDIYRARVDQKIVVDTSKPELQLDCEQRGHIVHLTWNGQDEHPDLANMRMELQVEGTDAAIPIQIIPGLKGSGHFPLPANSTGVVRLIIQDKAGNQTVAIRDVGKSLVQSQPILPAIPANASPVALTRNDQPSPSQPPPPDPTPNIAGIPPLPPASASIPSVPNAATGLASPTMVPVPNLPAGVPANNTDVSRGIPAMPVPNVPLQIAPTPAASSNAPIQYRGPLPVVQVVGKRPIRADIEVTRMGPSGIGSIEVWATHDDGLTWSLAGTETPTPGNGPGQKMSVNLPVSQEGLVHGFTLIVKSRAGLGRPAPQRGDIPNLRLELDSTYPEATLFSPQPDPVRRDNLILTWKAGDRNLTNQPIVLEWAEQRDGPWTNVAGADLPNTGRYLWQVPANVPPAVFLKLTVKDQAGNIAVAQTQDALLVDLNIPEFQVIGLQGR